MPIYEYHCDKCEAEVEILLRGKETPMCPQCGSSKLDKLLSVAAAPAKTGGLPVCGPAEPATCGRPQCGSGRCMFD